MVNRLLATLVACLAICCDRASAFIDLSEVDKNGYFDARTSGGNTTGLNARSLFEDSSVLGSLEKRQQCAAGYGTCPGGTQCGCPAGAGCCGSICSSRDNTCCSGYLCAPGFGCCGPASSQRCYPYGSQCCFDGRYCPSGSSCVRYDGESSARCRVFGATSDVEPTYSSLPPGGGGTSSDAGPTTTAYTPGSGSETIISYTVTFIIYWYEYYTTTSYFEAGFTSTTFTSISYSQESKTLTLITSGTDSYEARSQLSSEADRYESSSSSSAESLSSSYSSRISTNSISQSQARASSAASSASRSPSTAAGGSSGGSSGGGSSGSAGGGGASAGTTLKPAGIDTLFLITFSGIVGLVGALMILL